MFGAAIAEPTRIALLKIKLTLLFWASTKKPWHEAIFPSGIEFTAALVLPVVETVAEVAVPPVRLNMA